MAHGSENLNGNVAGWGKRLEPADEAERLEAGRRLFAQECRFMAGAVVATAIPAAALPEVAFAGRSNVGKSSLVNALTGHKALARISATPGRTRQINFFVLGRRLMLVDLPGYGYARASKQEVAAWTGLTRRYLEGRPSLSRVLLLIDCRHGLKDADRTAMALLDRAAVSYQLVLTKCDKLKPDRLEAIRAAIALEAVRHTAAHPEIRATSALTGEGLPELRAELAALALDRPEAA